MKVINVSPLAYILLKSETSAIRFWFGLTSFFFGVFLASNSASHWEYLITFIVMPHWAWGTGFMISGAAMIRGAITSKFNTVIMFLESILGTMLWVGVAASSMMSQGGPGAVTIAATMSIWLLIRYPTWGVVR